MFRWRHWLKNARDFEMGSKIAWHFNCTSGPGILDLSLMYLIVISYCDQNVVETLCLKNMDNVVQNLGSLLLMGQCAYLPGEMVLKTGVSLYGSAFLWSLWWWGVLEKGLKAGSIGLVFSFLSLFHCLFLASSLHCPHVTCA